MHAAGESAPAAVKAATSSQVEQNLFRRHVPIVLTLRGNSQRKPLCLSGANTDLGRSPGTNLNVDDRKASRQHARIVWENVEATSEYPRCWLEDRNSHNGTYLNHRRIAWERLVDGDRILIGTTVFGFCIREENGECADNAMIHAGILDSLTGLFTRLHFEEEVHRYTSIARRHKRPVCLSLLDIDSFSTINDREGHFVGDFMLKHVAGVIRMTLRQTDFATRVESDRFAVLWPETPLNETIVATERLRSAIAASPLTLRGEPLTFSVRGAAVQLSARHNSWKDLFEEATRVIVTAKRSGGRVVSAPRDQ